MYENPTWSALLESRDTNPGFLCSGLAQGVRGKRKSSVAEVGVSELQGQRQCWSTAFPRRGDVWCASNANWDLCPPTHLLTKHPFPLKHEFNSLMVLIFFLYYYFMGQYPALYDLSARRIEI